MNREPGPVSAFVPPRPNPGPEPFDPGGPSPLPLVLPVMVVVAFAAAALWLGRRRGLPARVDGSDRRPEMEPGSPTGEVVALAQAARDALAVRFGPAWRARTTEELAADPELAASFGPETAERLFALLRAADQRKFDPSGSEAADGQGHDLDAWSNLVSGLVAASGARSRITGR